MACSFKACPFPVVVLVNGKPPLCNYHLSLGIEPGSPADPADYSRLEPVKAKTPSYDEHQEHYRQRALEKKRLKHNERLRERVKRLVWGENGENGDGGQSA